MVATPTRQERNPLPRALTLIGAPSNIGIRPYDDGTPRRLSEAPQALREAGLGVALGAADAGDVTPEPYRDFVRPLVGARNQPEVRRYSEALAARVKTTIAGGGFPIVVGGDCSVVLGCLLGARQAGIDPIGLAYLDAHADFGTPEESLTGSAASMCLALAVGRGDPVLANLADSALIADRHVALVGRRDGGEPWYGHDALAASAILDLAGEAMRRRPLSVVLSQVLEQVAGPEVEAFWVHLDADLLSPAIMPAVDSPLDGGPLLDEAVALLGPLVRHPKALGFELTIYDPSLDPGRDAAQMLVTLLTRAFHEPGAR